jgi:hypothetical protein
MLRRVMNKNIDVDVLRKTMKSCKDAGIFTVGSVIMPSPGETEQSRRDTAEFLLDVRPDSAIIEPPGLIPGTPWVTDGGAYGVEILDHERFENEFMQYKMNIMYPPSLLRSFPYIKIDGKTDASLLRETSTFSQMMQQHEILTQVSVDTALIARYAGRTPLEFRETHRMNFLTGNSEAIAREIEIINGNIQGPFLSTDQ